MSCKRALSLLLQKYSVLQIWRSMIFFISSVAGMDAVVEAIKWLNGFGVPSATEVVRPGLFSESGCLTITDMKDFGTWLTTISTVTSAELSAKITEFMKRRLVKLNIASAPADKIKDAPCMHPTL